MLRDPAGVGGKHREDSASLRDSDDLEGSVITCLAERVPNEHPDGHDLPLGCDSCVFAELLVLRDTAAWDARATYLGIYDCHVSVLRAADPCNRRLREYVPRGVSGSQAQLREFFRHTYAQWTQVVCAVGCWWQALEVTAPDRVSQLEWLADHLAYLWDNDDLIGVEIVSVVVGEGWDVHVHAYYDAATRFQYAALYGTSSSESE